MPITIKIMRRAAGAVPSLYATRDLDALPVTIGRDPGCNFVLEDPHKHISRFHVEIEEEGGVYWMSVVSKVNPVMVKGRRYGPGTRLTLHSGDSFDIAEYEIQVMLAEVAVGHAAEAPESHEHVRKALSTTQTEIEDAAAPAEVAEADDAERIFNEATFLGLDEPGAKPDPRQEPVPEETFIPQQAAATAAPAAAGPLRAFMEGAGVPYKELSPSQSEQLLRDCGAILRVAVEGLMTLLRTRSEIRSGIQPEDYITHPVRDNNPLRRMSHAAEAMAFLLDPSEHTGGFLDPAQAIGDACEDLRAHELALMAGLRAAILGALHRFDPPAIERAFDEEARGFSFGGRKAKLWEAFVELQDRMSRGAEEDFNRVFGRDFMGAYQSQLRRMKDGR
jgi:predicted component of type VI protein secretion system